MASMINAMYLPGRRYGVVCDPRIMNFDHINRVYLEYNVTESDRQFLRTGQESDMKPLPNDVQWVMWTLRELKKAHPRLEIFLSFGKSSSPSQIINFDELNKQAPLFATLASSLVKKHGFDGVDIAESFHDDKWKGRLFLIMCHVHSCMAQNGKFMVTMTLPASIGDLRDLPLESISTIIDGFNLLCYDFYTTQSPVCGYQSAMYPAHNDAPSISTAVDYLIKKGIRSERIILGIPTHGWSFLGASSAGDTYTGAGGRDGIFAYRKLPRPGSVFGTTGHFHGAICVGGDGGFVTYDDPQSVTTKATFVKENKLAGLFYSDATMDSPHRSMNLAACGFRVMNEDTSGELPSAGLGLDLEED